MIRCVYHSASAFPTLPAASAVDLIASHLTRRVDTVVFSSSFHAVCPYHLPLPSLPCLAHMLKPGHFLITRLILSIVGYAHLTTPHPMYVPHQACNASHC